MTSKTDTQNKLNFIINEINEPKNKIMYFQDQLWNISESKAASLGKIIAKLEAWQNKNYKELK